MDRSLITLKNIHDPDDYGFVPGTPESRLALVWALTKEACSLNQAFNAERRLQRHITRLISRKG